MQGYQKSVVLVLVLTLVSLSWPVMAEEAPLTALNDAENALYGESSPTLSIVERVEELERDLLGEVSSGPLINRIATLTELLTGAGNEVSINLKVTTLEWYSNRKVTSGSLEERIARLETLYFGGPQEGSLIKRIDELVGMTFPEGKFDVALVKVPDGQTIKISLQTELSSGKSKVGDPVIYIVAEDLRLNNRLVIPAGSEGVGRVQNVIKAGNLGREGRVVVDFGLIRAIDGTMIPLELDKEAMDKNKSMELAAGVSLAGVLLLGPIGLAGGYFVKGKDVTIPMGTEFYVQIDGPIPVGGLGEVR